MVLMSYFLYSGKLHINIPATLDKEEAAHLLLSRRVKVGEQIEVQDTIPNRFICSVSKLGKKDVTLNPLYQVELPPPPKRTVHVYQAYTAEQTIHTIIQKLTELGVQTLSIFPSKHSPARPLGDKLSRWQRISLEAAKQSGRPLPVSIRLDTFTNFIKTCTPESQNIFLSQHAPKRLVDLLSKTKASAPIHLWIGPEGGWTPDEEAQLTAQGAEPACMGPYTLRAETAAIVASGIALNV